MGLGSSVHPDGCSELGMTPWSLSSMDVKSLSVPSHSPLRGWLGASVDAKLFPSPIPLATLQVDCSRGSPRVGRGSRKDARPRNLAGGRCPLPVWVPAVQPSGHALGAETQVLSTPPSRLARGSRAGGCPEIAQGRAGTGAWRGGCHVTRPERTWPGTARR